MRHAAARHLPPRIVLLRALLATAMAATLAAGCGTTASPSPSAGSPSPSPASPSPSAASPSPSPLSPAPSTPEPTAPGPTLVPTPSTTLPPLACGETVRQAGTVPIARIADLAVANDGATGRITFTFLPQGNVAALPEVEVRPATPPFTMDPSGLPLQVAGTAFIVVTLRGGTALDDDYNPTFDGPFDVDPAGGPIVEAKRAGDFEAVSSWVVGVDGPPCVRILPPDGSGRLVIEIETEG